MNRFREQLVFCFIDSNSITGLGEQGRRGMACTGINLIH